MEGADHRGLIGITELGIVLELAGPFVSLAEAIRLPSMLFYNV